MSRIAGVLVLVSLLAVAASGGCRKEAAPGRAAAASTGGTDAAGAPTAAAPVSLEDVMERDPRYLVGISYPPAARAYPGLARLLKDYADAARAEVMQAVSGLGGSKPTAPYDLSLGFSMLMETPDIVAVAADGSSYTGGAHGNPLVARFVWLPRRNQALTASRLVPDAAGWTPVAAFARDALAAGLSARIDDGAPSPEERAEMMRNGARMIDEGTAPAAANFDEFEPIAGPGGRLAGLRFVFPPYQVGPYSDGVQSVDVPAAVLLPVVAPEYRSLFEGG
jgi:hypothetical protein